MIRNNIVRANNWRGDNCQTAQVYQYDYGLILKIEGLDLPNVFEVHFTNTDNVPAIERIGSNDGIVVVPDILLKSAKNIIAYIYLHTSDSDGETVKTITIPASGATALTRGPSNLFTPA